jgi:hypothetical protein
MQVVCCPRAKNATNSDFSQKVLEEKRSCLHQIHHVKAKTVHQEAQAKMAAREEEMLCSFRMVDQEQKEKWRLQQWWCEGK